MFFLTMFVYVSPTKFLESMHDSDELLELKNGSRKSITYNTY